MNARRKEAWERIERTLRGCPFWGVVYISHQGRRVETGYRIPWPFLEEGGREEALQEIADQLAACGDGWRIWFYRLNDADDSHGWPWPGVAGLFDHVVEENAASCEQAAAPEVADAEIVGEVPGPEVAGPRAQQLADLRKQMAPGRGANYSTDCAADVLRVMRQARRRLTLTAIADELSLLHLPWSHTAISHTVPQMRNEGVLTHARDQLGKGYGLPEWTKPVDVEVETEVHVEPVEE